MERLSEQENLFVQMIALNGMKSLANERTLQAFYHILRGRRANQTLQDVHLFRLYPYYRLFPHLLREQWEEILQQLIGQGYIREKDLDRNKTTFVLTDEGEKWVSQGWTTYGVDQWLGLFHQHPWVNGHLQTFWLRLHLMVQTLSCLLEGNPSFYPVVQDRQIQSFVKSQLHDPTHRKRWMDGVFAELYKALEVLPSDIQPLLVKQFSGAHQTALTMQQLAYQEKLPPSLIRVKWRFGVASVMIQVKETPDLYPLLAALLPEEQSGGSQMSSSAQETYRLLQKQIPIEKIAQIRGITRNTVEDHLVDIAFHEPAWDASPYLTDEARRQILETSARLHTRRLRLIREALDDRYSYLQIRLALAIGEARR
ncbi:helix-turn-helix domain-containing protein [Brevibacillus migulae]|uniref:helix-turn-helix domain-containing protein n=1 Tax=Brevibacillus migulae TaxID=1644114 RepID=UPI00106EE20B|nr:helix-turn-helix domain-containing protein [Brevibacillus migulae]